MPREHRARACVITAPGSGHGKTWLTAALARRCAREGRRVRVLKTGSDFIDPAILARAAGSPVHTLDLWMGGEHECERQLGDAAREADIVLVEGVMGLFDGLPSTADLAQRFGLAVLLVVDASAMAQTFGAVVHGLVDYCPDLHFVGALANRVAGAGHAEMLADSLRDRRTWCGAIFSDDRTTLPERHLGLVMPEEVCDLDARIERAADALLGFDLERLPVCDFTAVAAPRLAPELRGVRIAVARDAAFCFVYPANLDLLRELGAELRFFSPRDDQQLPEADALYLPGGYPELHASALSQNATMCQSICSHIDQKKPVLAECGGLMLLARALRTLDGSDHEMVGSLDLEIEMQPQLAAIGHYACELAEGPLRGHAFHHSIARGPAFHSELATSPHGGCPEPVYRRERLVASYVHWYLPSNPEAAVRLFAP
jgi:cobyrinic acid a,c-diamide synthase